MKKKITVLMLVFTLLLLSGCSGCGGNAFGSVDKGIYLHDDLSLLDVIVSDAFKEADYYDIEELKGLWQNEIDEYNATHEFKEDENRPSGSALSDSDINSENKELKAPLTMIACREDKGNVVLKLRYATVKDYLEYNADIIPGKGGTILKAGLIGDMDGDLKALSYTDMEGKTVDVTELAVSAPKDYRYLYVDFEAVLYGTGNIFACSDMSKVDKEKNCVVVPEGEAVCVIFK